VKKKRKQLKKEEENFIYNWKQDKKKTLKDSSK
jgi:hypothetical protein